MRLIVCENYEKMSQVAADIIASQLILKPTSKLGLATGTTPIGTYDRLVEMNKAGKIDFSLVETFNLDEYYPISPDNDQSYRYFMNKYLFDRVNMDKNKLENYKLYLKQIQDQLTDEDVKNMTKEERQEYVTLVAQIKARLDLLEENL